MHVEARYGQLRFSVIKSWPIDIAVVPSPIVPKFKRELFSPLVGGDICTTAVGIGLKPELNTDLVSDLNLGKTTGY